MNLNNAKEIVEMNQVMEQLSSQPADRKYFIDNLRSFTVFILFPYHICLIYNNWGEHWYIHETALLIPSIFKITCDFWMMPLLFAIAGISSRYALKKRSVGEYAKERVGKLLIPFIFGLLLVIPFQSFIAGIYFNNEVNYLNFFTKITELNGYDGTFTPGNLWFIPFLFVISMASLPFMIWYKNKGKGTLGDKIPLILIVLMGLLPCIGSNIKIGGKSPTEDLAYFILAFFFLSNDKLLERLDKYRFVLFGSYALYAAFTTFVLHGEFYEMASWLGILTILGMGRHYLDFTGKITRYLSKSCFGVYIFHQTWIVVTAFYILKISSSPAVQIPFILSAAVILTILTYEICRRIPATRWMFGLKK